MIAISIVALGISLLALPFTAWAAMTASKQAKSARIQAEAAEAQTAIQREQVAAAREQTRLQRELSREALQPYVWADIQPDMQQGTVMHIVVGSNGPTVAQNVRVTFDPPLPAGSQQSDKVGEVQRILASGLHSLAPGRQIRWTLGAGYDLLASSEPQVRTIRIEADGPAGPLPVVEFELDISQWRQARDAPDGSLHHVRGAIKDLTKAVAGVGKTLDAVAQRATRLQPLETVAIDEMRDEVTRLAPATPEMPQITTPGAEES